jgi:arylsulfatase A-like enzyme
MYWGHDMKFHGENLFPEHFASGIPNSQYRRMNAEQKKAWDAAFGPRNKAFLANPPTGKDLVRWKYQRYVKNYIRCIDSVDENVGRVIDYLEANDLRDNTIIVYSSDQGFYLGDHGWYDKRWMFEESLKMPLLISWPGKIKPGTRYKQLVQNIDYGPTFLSAAGLNVPGEMQGKSMVPLFANPAADWRKSIYYHYYEHGGEHRVPRHEGVRNDRYKLINLYSNDGYFLFDLKNDPREMKSVHANPEYADTLAAMKADLKSLRSHYELPPLKGKKK